MQGHIRKPQIAKRLVPMMDLVFLLLTFFIILPHGITSKERMQIERLKEEKERVKEHWQQKIEKVQRENDYYEAREGRPPSPDIKSTMTLKMKGDTLYVETLKSKGDPLSVEDETGTWWRLIPHDETAKEEARYAPWEPKLGELIQKYGIDMVFLDLSDEEDYERGAREEVENILNKLKILCVVIEKAKVKLE